MTEYKVVKVKDVAKGWTKTTQAVNMEVWLNEQVKEGWYLVVGGPHFLILKKGA
jgi:hypothetical protein